MSGWDWAAVAAMVAILGGIALHAYADGLRAWNRRRKYGGWW